MWGSGRDWSAILSMSKNTAPGRWPSLNSSSPFRCSPPRCHEASTQRIESGNFARASFTFASRFLEEKVDPERDGILRPPPWTDQDWNTAHYVDHLFEAWSRYIPEGKDRQSGGECAGSVTSWGNDKHFTDVRSSEATKCEENAIRGPSLWCIFFRRIVLSFEKRRLGDRKSPAENDPPKPSARPLLPSAYRSHRKHKPAHDLESERHPPPPNTHTTTDVFSFGQPVSAVYAKQRTPTRTAVGRLARSMLNKETRTHTRTHTPESVLRFYFTRYD